MKITKTQLTELIREAVRELMKNGGSDYLQYLPEEQQAVRPRSKLQVDPGDSGSPGPHGRLPPEEEGKPRNEEAVSKYTNLNGIRRSAMASFNTTKAVYAYKKMVELAADAGMEPPAEEMKTFLATALVAAKRRNDAKRTQELETIAKELRLL